MDSALGLPDWREEEAYAELLRAEPPTFAWEWLRRVPDYRAAALRHGFNEHHRSIALVAEQLEAKPWGLHAFEDPALSAYNARPIWRSDRHPFVLRAAAGSSRCDSESIAFARFRDLATLCRGEGIEHLLLSNGFYSIRLDIRGASLLEGPMRLSYDVEGIATAKLSMVVLQRFLAFLSNNAFSRSLHGPDTRAMRQILLLRTFDALQDGADQRTIAAELLSKAAGDARWRVNSPSLRSRAQRLVSGARQFAHGTFWSLLE